MIGSNPSYFKGKDLPVEQVSWNDLHDADGFLLRTGLVLPTEAQWEYACRAGTGGFYSGTGNMDDMGWYLDNSNTGNGHETHPVGEKQPNQFGLYDMHGNVAEWCEGVFDAKDVPDFGSMSEVRIGRGGAKLTWFARTRSFARRRGERSG